VHFLPPPSSSQNNQLCQGSAATAGTAGGGQVTGSHTYAEQGSFLVTVTLAGKGVRSLFLDGRPGPG
jgi:hypothetical protein